MIRRLLETLICSVAACVAVIVVAVVFSIILPDIPLGQPMEWFDYVGGTVAIVAEICVAIFAFRNLRKFFASAHARRRLRNGFCVKCAYDLSGNESGVCPECGMEVGQS